MLHFKGCDGVRVTKSARRDYAEGSLARLLHTPLIHMKLTSHPRLTRPPRRNSLIWLLLGALCLSAAGAPQAASPPASSSTLLGVAPKNEFLNPDVAFRLAVTPEGQNRVRLSWAIAEGYYLYQSR